MGVSLELWVIVGFMRNNITNTQNSLHALMFFWAICISCLLVLIAAVFRYHILLIDGGVWTGT